MSNALYGSADTRGVHEGEHALKAFVGWANQIASCTIEVQYAGGRSADAHFVLDGANSNGVALAHIAFNIDIELRHDEQGNATRARRRVWKASQHDVNDVFT